MQQNLLRIVVLPIMGPTLAATPTMIPTVTLQFLPSMQLRNPRGQQALTLPKPQHPTLKQQLLLPTMMVLPLPISSTSRLVRQCQSLLQPLIFVRVNQQH